MTAYWRFHTHSVASSCRRFFKHLASNPVADSPASGSNDIVAVIGR